jgi:hypothetical protein
MLLFAAGAMFSAALTGSRGSLAVALVAGCMWNGMRVYELVEPHMPFIAFWLVGAFLAVAWNSAVARHLVAVAAVSWWGNCAFGAVGRFADPTYAFATGVSLLLGGGVLLASRGPQPLTALGGTLSHYGAFALALAEAVIISNIFGSSAHGVPVWMLACGLVAIVCAFAAAVVVSRAGPALAGLSIAIGLAIVSGWDPLGTREPWLAYALALLSMLALVLSGILDDERPRVIAGWIGLAAAIAAITWTVPGSLLGRAAFLAIAGIVAVALASLLGRVFHKERTA